MYSQPESGEFTSTYGRRGRIASPIRAALRLLVAVQGALAIVLLSASAYMWVVWHRTGLLPPDDPHPEPQPPAASRPWFMQVCAASGALALLSAGAGLSGLRAENRRRLVLHVLLLASLVLAEAVALVVMFTDNPWREKLPVDPSGFFDTFQQWLFENARTAKFAALGLLCAQLIDTALSCWLHALYTADHDDYIDGLERRRAQTQEMLGIAVRREASGSPETVWGRRMREKYGVSSREVLSQEQRERQASLLAEDEH